MNYCIKNKGVTIFSWVLMSNHLHLVAKVEEPLMLSNFLRDFKRFTSIEISSLIKKIPESRRYWLLDQFSFEARRTKRAEYFKIWKDGNHAIWLGDIDILEKVDYIHQNPVKAEIVDEAEDYVYSSARDYAGVKGLVNVSCI